MKHKVVKNVKKLVFIPLIVIIVLSIITTSYSKYVHNSVRNYYLKSKGFYFDSENLSANTKKNSNLSWDGTDIYFTINNYLSDDLITSFDIPYKVTCEIIGNNNYTCNLNNTNSSIYEGTLSANSRCVNNSEDGVNVSSMNKTDCELGGYTWQKEKSSKELSFNLTSQDPIIDVDVKITVESLNKYKQKLVGIYKLHKKTVSQEDLVTIYENYINYDKLIITNVSNSKKCVSINFDTSKLRIDNSIVMKNYNIDSNSYINELEVEINKDEIKELYFYKINLNENYTISDLNISECS